MQPELSMITKTNPSELAVNGAPPAFDEKLHVGRPNIGNRQQLLARIDDILDKKWLTNKGYYVQAFEKRIAEIMGVKHCIAMSSGTVALEIAIRALDLTGDVIVPSFTFIATAHALQWQEITPVFCDVDPLTHTIDPAGIEQLITPRTTGIIGVHLWGRACNIDGLTEIARRRNLKLLFDAAHAFGSTCQGRMIGQFGDAEVFSFHATKFVNALEGGAIVTNNDALAEKARLMKNFGFTNYDEVGYIGTNGKMNEISAAMGLTSLESMAEFAEVNYRNYRHYQRGLADIPGIKLLTYPRGEKSNYQYVVVEIDETITKISRDRLIEILHAENVLARRYFYPGCHRMEPYRSCFPDAGLLLPATERLVERVIVLPTGTAIQPVDIQKICRIIQLAILTNSEITGGERRNNLQE